MEETMKNKGQNMEDVDVIKQLMDIMKQQGMNKQSQEFMEVVQYVDGMQSQFKEMVEELKGVREQLVELQKNQPKAIKDQLLEKISLLQEKVTNLAEQMASVKEQLIDTAKQAITAFKEKGKEGMNHVLQKGISGVKSVLEDVREKMSDVLGNYEKTANQIDNIGNELKQIGNSFANVGRLIAGKEAKEVSSEKPGVALTRVINMPLKKNIESLRNQIEGLDKKIDKLSEYNPLAKVEELEEANYNMIDGVLNNKKTKKEKEGKRGKEKERISVKDKLSKMKEKSKEISKKTPVKEKSQEMNM